MNNAVWILSIDISGNFNEGKGESGWFFAKFWPGSKIPCPVSSQHDITGSIKAKNFSTQQEYHQAHLDMINNNSKIKGYVVVIEDYRIRPGQSQKFSQQETLQLVGKIKALCFEKKYPLLLQQPGIVKPRWNDQRLLNHNLITPKGNGGFSFKTKDHKDGSLISITKINRHQLDALRHLLHAWLVNKKNPFGFNSD